MVAHQLSEDDCYLFCRTAVNRHRRAMITTGRSNNTLFVANMLKGQSGRLRVGLGGVLHAKRFQSNVAKTGTIIDKNSIFVASIPITNYKSYIFCNHQPSVLDATQLKSILWVTKLESKVTSVAVKGWKKMNESEVSVNVKVVKMIKKLLDTIPYEENCLRSFPSQKLMIREINEEYAHQAEHLSTQLLQAHADKLQIPSSQIKPIPLYHPQFQLPSTILNQLCLFRDSAYLDHLKYAVLCAIGIPISLPFALVPVLPNVPGFYLAYRLYCNVKALLGVKHLDYLLEDCTHKSSTASSADPQPQKSIADTKHIAFNSTAFLDEAYRSNSALDGQFNVSEEKVIITSDIINTICEKFDWPHLNEDLHKALRQESLRLQKAQSAPES